MKLKDYSYHFGLLNKMTKQGFESLEKLYSQRSNEVYRDIKSLQDEYQMLERNINYFKQEIKRLHLLEVESNFVLKPEHLKILNSFYIHFDGERNGLRTENLGYLYSNYLKIVFDKDKSDVSENQMEEYYKQFDRLMEEIPYAIKFLANQVSNINKETK